MAIGFYSADLNCTLKSKVKIKEWLNEVVTREGFVLDSLSIIFCSDEYLYNMNVKFLQHDTYTDIITFDQSISSEIIEGELYISIDRIRENAKSLSITFTNELHRVIVHGLLHLCGYTDKTNKNKNIMSSKEDFYLSLRKFL